MIVQHLYYRPLAGLGLGRTYKLPNSHALQPIEAPGSSKLGQSPVDSSNKCVDGFDQQNGVGEAWASPSNSSSEHAKISTHQNSTRGPLDKDIGCNFPWILMNNQCLRFHNRPPQVECSVISV